MINIPVINGTSENQAVGYTIFETPSILVKFKAGSLKSISKHIMTPNLIPKSVSKVTRSGGTELSNFPSRVRCTLRYLFRRTIFEKNKRIVFQWSQKYMYIPGNNFSNSIKYDIGIMIMPCAILFIESLLANVYHYVYTIISCSAWQSFYCLRINSKRTVDENWTNIELLVKMCNNSSNGNIYFDDAIDSRFCTRYIVVLRRRNYCCPVIVFVKDRHTHRCQSSFRKNNDVGILYNFLF